MITMDGNNYSWKYLADFYNSTPEPETKQASEMFPGFEGLWCKLIMAVTSFATTENSVALIYAPLNCNWAIRNFKTTNYSLFYDNAFIHMPTVKIDQNVVIMGGIEKLTQGIIDVDKLYKPSLIGVFDSCSSALIADDIESAIKTASLTTSAAVKYFPSAGLAAPWLGKSIEAIAYEYVNMMENFDKIPDTVNIVGQYKEKYCLNQKRKTCNFHDYIDEATELEKYIGALNLKLHRVLISGGPEYIKTASKASFNVISCPTWGIPIANLMQEKFNIPFSNSAIPMGFQATKDWIYSLAEITDKMELAEIFVNKMYSSIESEIEDTIKLTSGKIALIECGRNTQTSFARAMALGRMCSELNMKPYFFNAHPLEVKAKKFDVDYFLGDGFNPLFLFGSYPYQKPISVLSVIKDLGLSQNDFIYFSEDVFPFAKSMEFDQSNVAKVESSVHLRRIKGSTSRGMGFSGFKAFLNQIQQSLKTSNRKTNPTLYSRINGKFYEFEY